MRVKKHLLSLDDQVKKLVESGLQGNPSIIKQRLKSVSYYRLSGYFPPFLKYGETGEEECFIDGTTIDMIWRHYVFDRRLRLLIMDALERIEISIRAKLAFHHANEYGEDPFAYEDKSNWTPPMTQKTCELFFEKMNKQVASAKKRRLEMRLLFTSGHDECHCMPPIWTLMEVISFSTLLEFYENMPTKIKKTVANDFNMPFPGFESWLRTCVVVRNACAHHERLWNKIMGLKPMMPRLETHTNKYIEWHVPVKISNDRIFSVLTICSYCLKFISPQSRWRDRLENLYSEFEDIPKEKMGFPENWRSSPLWIWTWPEEKKGAPC